MADRSQRTVGQVLVETVSAVTPLDSSSEASRGALAELAYLNDAALWQAGRATMSPSQRARLEYLHGEQQQRSLSEEEQGEEQALLTLYRETILVRAQAAVLLKQRGYDVTDPTQFDPLT